MKPRTCGLLAMAAFALADLLGSAQSFAQNAYIANYASNNVSVIATKTNAVCATIPVGFGPQGVAVSPDGSKVYVTNVGDSTVSVIATATNTVIGAPIQVGTRPQSAAVTPDGSKVYVTNGGNDATNSPNTVSVIDTTTNAVIATIGVGLVPIGVAVTPDSSTVYVANSNSNSVSVIDTATNSVIATIQLTGPPMGIAVTPDGSTVYVGTGLNTVSVIATATNTVIGLPITVHYVPWGVAVTPDGSKVYVVDQLYGAVSVIATATNTVLTTILLNPNGLAQGAGLAVTPDGSKVYVANYGLPTVSVIDTATDTLIGSPIPVGYLPYSLGVFIQPTSSNCQPAGAGGGGGTLPGRVLGPSAVLLPSYVGYLMSTGMSITQAITAILSGTAPPVITGRGPVPEQDAAYLSATNTTVHGVQSIMLSLAVPGSAASKQLADDGLKMMEQGVAQVRSLNARP